jgi:lipopolysaccharide/colanic/teichoic acid biosynthesis glycosyltransferase
MKSLNQREPSGFATVAHSGAATRRFEKMMFDILVIVSLSPIILILFLAAASVAGAIKLQTGESMLFAQDRVGQDGRIFRMWKFRTMITDPSGGEVTVVGDGRVAPLGNLLRKSHLDELPQIWNVLKGDMSLIGPRPEQPARARQYTLASPEFALRLRVLPGITGLAQVNYSYASDHSESMIKLTHDLHYIEHQSLALDASILAKTLLVVIRREGR